MASNKRVILQRFTAEQARKLILGSDNRMSDHLTDAEDNFSDESKTEYVTILENSKDESFYE